MLTVSLQPTVFHLWLQRRLIEMSQYHEFSFDEAQGMMKNYKIPLSLRRAIVKEMENMRLIARVSRRSYMIENPSLCEKINDISNVYHELGCFA